jgi:hypothetical protein
LAILQNPTRILTKRLVRILAFLLRFFMSTFHALLILSTLFLSASPRAEPTTVPTTQETSHLQFRLIADDNDPRPADIMPLPDQPQTSVHVLKEVEMDENSVESAHTFAGQDGEPCIALVLTDAGSKQFSKLTSENLHHRIAIFFNGKLLCAPFIQSRMSKEAAIILGADTSEAEREEMVKQINELVDDRTAKAATRPSQEK